MLLTARKFLLATAVFLTGGCATVGTELPVYTEADLAAARSDISSHGVPDKRVVEIGPEHRDLQQIYRRLNKHTPIICQRFGKSSCPGWHLYVMDDDLANAYTTPDKKSGKTNIYVFRGLLEILDEEEETPTC